MKSWNVQVSPDGLAGRYSAEEETQTSGIEKFCYKLSVLIAYQ